MTIREAMAEVDRREFNTYPAEEKVRWLSRLDTAVHNDVIATHEGGGEAFAGYGEDTDTDAALLAPSPYDAMYPLWLEAQIHYANKELDKYNAAIVRFDEEYSAFERWYNRTHTPRHAGSRFIW